MIVGLIKFCETLQALSYLDQRTAQVTSLAKDGRLFSPAVNLHRDNSLGDGVNLQLGRKGRKS